jgi:HSP20 family protein
LETITADRFPAFTQLGVPLLDMQETSDELIVTAEVPGLKKEDFTVELLGRRLTIKGEKKVAQERKRADGSMLAECRYGSFTRSVLLPYEVNGQEVTGDLSNGILTLRLKKPEAERGRRFRVPVS